MADDLFSNVGGLFGSAAAGYNLGQQQQGTALENMLRQTQAVRGAIDNQFDDANLQTRIQQAAANLQATVGQNQTRDLSNQFTTATQPGAITATNSNNSLVPITNQTKEIQERLQMFTPLAAQASTMSPVARMAWANSLVQKYPGLAQEPEFDQIVANPQNALAGYKTAILNQPKAVDDSNKATVQGTQRMQEIGAQGQNALDLEQKRIDAGKYNKTQNAQAMIQKLLSNPSYEKLASYSDYILSDPDIDQTTKDRFTTLATTVKADLDRKNIATKSDAVTIDPATGKLKLNTPYGARQDQGASNLADPLGIR